jgi:hypothetical protein
MFSQALTIGLTMLGTCLSSKLQINGMISYKTANVFTTKQEGFGF